MNLTACLECQSSKWEETLQTNWLSYLFEKEHVFFIKHFLCNYLFRFSSVLFFSSSSSCATSISDSLQCDSFQCKSYLYLKKNMSLSLNLFYATSILNFLQCDLSQCKICLYSKKNIFLSLNSFYAMSILNFSQCKTCFSSLIILTNCDNRLLINLLIKL